MVDLSIVDCYANLMSQIVKNAYQDISLYNQFLEREKKGLLKRKTLKVYAAERNARDAELFLQSDWCKEICDYLRWYNSIRNLKPRNLKKE